MGDDHSVTYGHQKEELLNSLGVGRLLYVDVDAVQTT